MRFNLTPVFIRLCHDDVMLYRSYTCRGGQWWFILLPWFKFQHNCPDNGRKKAEAPRRASSDTPAHKRRPGALRHNRAFDDFHDVADYCNFTHYSARNIDNSDGNEDDQLSSWVQQEPRDP